MSCVQHTAVVSSAGDQHSALLGMSPRSLMDLMSSPSDALDLRRELRKMTQERDAAIQAHKEEVHQGLALFSLLPASILYF